MGSSIGKAIKRIAVIVLVVAAVVFVAALAVYALGIATMVGLPAAATATLGGFVQAAGAAVASVIANPAFMISTAIGAYQAYAVDKKKVEAMKAVSEAETAAEAEVRDHFSVMEKDRYDKYDPPKLGIGFSDEEEKSFDKTLGNESSFPWFTGLLISATVLGIVLNG